VGQFGTWTAIDTDHLWEIEDMVRVLEEWEAAKTHAK
jgi:hypothetical protein